jgi:hypothetical protein
MSYVPYTGTKDYFEEPNSGNDLVLQFNNDAGTISVSAMEETDLVKLKLVPPSSRIGTKYGKTLDIVKVFVPAGRSTGDTVQLFTNPNSGFATIFTVGIYPFMGKAFSTAGLSSLLPATFAGKILRVDYIPMSDGSGTAAAIVTFLLYV